MGLEIMNFLIGISVVITIVTIYVWFKVINDEIKNTSKWKSDFNKSM